MTRRQSASVRTVRLTRGGKPASTRAWSASGLKAAMALPELVQWAGQAAADVAEDVDARDALDALDEDDVGPVRDGEVDGVAGGPGDLAQGRQRDVPGLVAGLGELAEVVEVDAEPVLAR